MSNIEQTTGAADERFNRAFVNDVQGNAVYVNQGAGHTGRVQNQPGGYLGGWVGDSVNPGHVQRQLVANGEVLARYGDAPDSENPPNPGDIPKYVDTAEFRLNAAPLKLKGANLDAIAYTVVGGETLKDIARNVLGDAKLWWRIAEANGLAVSGDGQLAAGQTLSVPKLALNANNVDTFQPYDPSRVTGSMDPNLPAPAGQGGGGCGGLGKIIMVAIAVVVAVYAPQFLGQLGIPELTVGGTTTALGGAVGGAAGSVASQVAGNVLGVQDGFSWKSVALSAIGGGMSSGLANTELLGGTTFGATVARAAVGNVMSQGIGVVTGLQDRFDWKSVAASAVGAGVGQMVGEALGGYSLREGLAGPVTAPAFSGLGDFAGSLARGTLTGLAAGTAAAVMRGGRVSIQQVATDAFGNALGESLAGANGQSPRSAGENDSLDAFLALNDNFSGVDANGGVPMVNGRTFSQDMQARQAANNPAGLPTYVNNINGGVPAGYSIDPSGNGILGWQDRVPAQPSTVRAGDFGGSMERIARAQLGSGASQRDVNNYVGQLIEINGISNPRRVGSDLDIILPGASTPAATSGLGVYGKDIALGEQMKAAARAEQAADSAQAATAAYSGAGAGRGFVNPADESTYGAYPFAGRSTITDAQAFAPSLSTGEYARAAATGVGRTLAGTAESMGYSYGVIGSPQERADWAIRTVDAGIAGAKRFFGDVSGAVSTIWNGFSSNDPYAVENSFATGTGLAVGVGGAVVAGRLMSPNSAGVTVLRHADVMEQAGGTAGLRFARSEGLGSHASIAELQATRALPGEQGVIITDRSVRFGDVYELSQARGIEFSLVTEQMNGQYVKKLYSGDAWSSPVPRDARLIGHTHPNENAFQQWPSTQDMNIVNQRYFRELQINPAVIPTPSRIFWGTGNTDNTMFYPGFGKSPYSR